ncbi:bifunctional molybdopterin-guanine dinucleotide biosynthesis adaptor protein MobB/molybdopterin molybdotransferase MoeA [Neptunomonas concharum]|uniref:bifunctional molybdopterin-guanine dinucleotide biosynthesis adaptor protein MobB/molybdopterin molybdotransferase MoeA n=1 Tax=Neptunomonas concharum TaxID=1031538 RepID=UPI001B86A01F|nr:bifunctional molybdopterin-guanine dinucleotide biosynthesis adaptor protein MobB/molybdopterin molybdotransferase MoeA [Neptunomonas concharum]
MVEVISCFDAVANPGKMLPVEESINRILNVVPNATKTERIPLSKAMDRVLATDQYSPFNVPPHTNSAMDGYAIAFTDPLPVSWRLVGEAYAGRGYPEKLNQGEAVAIMTGAPVPEGADTIIIKEAASLKGAALSIQGGVQKGQHVRLAGEDIPRGSLCLPSGSLLSPQALGLLASMGLSSVEVFKPVKVAIFSTGDEVVDQGEALPEFGIYDTNRFTLRGMLTRLGCEVIDLGIIEDDQRSLSEALALAASSADIMLSSGGVSMGEADYIKSALKQEGRVDFWRIAMRPGRPLAFGDVGGKPFFGLPGNPVAVMVTFMQFVQPALRKMMGQTAWQPNRMIAIAEETLKSRLGRTDYSRGVYHINESGQLVVRSTGSQGSGILTSMVMANCLIEITDEFERIDVGEPVLIQPFSDLM